MAEPRWMQLLREWLYSHRILTVGEAEDELVEAGLEREKARELVANRNIFFVDNRNKEKTDSLPLTKASPVDVLEGQAQ